MTANQQQPLLSVIFVHYKNDEVLQNCLLSLANGINRHSWEVIICRNDGIKNNDKFYNGSGMSSANLSFIINKENLGFSKACNQGAEKAKGKLLLFLNPDTVLRKNSISDLIDFYGKKNNCGIAAPMILDPDGTIQRSARSFPSFRTAFFGRTSMLTNLFPSNRFTRAEFEAKQAHCETQEYSIVDWVSGAAILIKTSLYNKLDGFDERFFMYWEDADLCFKLSKLNYKVYYCKQTIIEHDAGACSKENRTQTIIEFHKSVYKYYCKNINKGQTIREKLLRVVIATGIKFRCIMKLALASISSS